VAKRSLLDDGRLYLSCRPDHCLAECDIFEIFVRRRLVFRL